LAAARDTRVSHFARRIYNGGMSYRCLADFIEDLGQAGEMLRVEPKVDPSMEVSEITRRVGDRAALLFGGVGKSDMPLVANLLGSPRRIARAFGAETLEELSERIATLLSPPRPEGWFEKLKTAPHFETLAAAPPRVVKSGPCQQIVNLGSDVDLRRLPLITSASEETSPAIHAAVLVTADAESRKPLAGNWSMQLLGPDRLGIFWDGHDEPMRLLADYISRGEKMPVAAVLGGPPALLPVARAPLPPTVDVMTLAGLLREKPLDVVAGRSVELQVPAEAEIVIEGYVDPVESTAEAGPMCTPLSFCTPRRTVTLMQVTAVTHRANPVYPAMIGGCPPNEACVIDRAMGQVFLPLVKLAIPELVDFDLPQFGAARHWAVLSMNKNHAGQARRVAAAAWGMRQFMFAKMLVIVDEDVDPHDQSQVLAAVASQVDPGRDVFTHDGPADPFDPAAESGGLGTRMAIDATAKLSGERSGLVSCRADVGDEIRRLVTDRWEEYGLGPRP